MKKIIKKPIALLLIFSSIFLVACRNKDAGTISLENPACEPQYAQFGAEEIQNLIDYNQDPTMQRKPKSGDTIATFKTNSGTIKALLYTEEAPETTKNFIELAKSKKYDDVIFHRVIDCFMIQTGDFEKSNGTGGYSYKGPGTTIEDEFVKELKNVRGALSMANRGPDTGGSQFFIVQAEHGTPWLDGKHAVFGYVYDGMDVVDEIASSEADASDRPLENKVIESVEIEIFE